MPETMTRDEVLLEIQRRIAKKKGYGHVMVGADDRLWGVVGEAEKHRLVPRWPQDWCDVRELVEEMCARPKGRLHVKQVSDGFIAESFEVESDGYPFMPSIVQVGGNSIVEAISRCWCAWQGIDLSDLTVTTEE